MVWVPKLDKEAEAALIETSKADGTFMRCPCGCPDFATVSQSGESRIHKAYGYLDELVLKS
jgi:hypothetical protein